MSSPCYRLGSLRPQLPGPRIFHLTNPEGIMHLTYHLAGW
jgi:hypothetical protein